MNRDISRPWLYFWILICFLNTYSHKMPKQRERCYLGCTLGSGVLHKFPQLTTNNMERFREWKSAVGVEHLHNNFIYDNIRVCSQHFENCYISLSHRLVATAVPTLILRKMEASNVAEEGNSEQDNAKHKNNNGTAYTENIPDKMVVNIPIKMELEEDKVTEVPLPIKCEEEEETDQVMEPVEITIKQEEYHVGEEDNNDTKPLQEEVIIKQEVGENNLEEPVNHQYEQAPNVIKQESVCNNTNLPKVICIVPVIMSPQPPAPARPESILPTNDDYTETYDHMFPLNSITSDMLPIHQQVPLLVRHQKQRQYTAMNIPCPKCPKLCKTRASYNNHLKAHESVERRMTSILKGLQTRRNKRAAIDLKRASDYKEDDSGRGEYTCSKCSKQYYMKGSLLRHQEHCAGVRDNLQCALCNKTYRTYVGLGHHEQVCKISRGKPAGETADYACSCGKVYRRRSRLETCLRAHAGYGENGQPVTRQHDCATCHIRFSTKNALSKHRNAQHPPRGTKRYPCKFCPIDYRTPKELFEHLQRHQQLQLMEYKVVSEVVRGGRELDCFMCNTSCQDIADLKLHVLEDHKCPYKCTQCKDTFLNIEDLTKHMKTTHPAIEGQPVLDVIEAFSILAQSWKCEQCEVQFAQPNLLAIHQAKIHQLQKGLTQFQCRFCSRMFESSKQLSAHLRLVHPFIDKPNGKMEKPLIMCVHCRKTCQDENALASHMRLHSPDRKFVCEFCDFRFATAEKCNEHTVIHTGEMKYVCFICEYRCSSQNRLNLHKQSAKHSRIRHSLLESANVTEHDNDSMKVEGNGSTAGMSEEVKCEKSELSSCNICGESFESESKMLEHKQTHPFIEFPNEDQPTRIFFK